MHRHHKYAAVVTWTATLILFVIALFESDPVKHYNYYAFGVLAALSGVMFTCLAGLDAIVGRVVSDELALSREKLSSGLTAAFAAEREARAEVTHIRPRH